MRSSLVRHARAVVVVAAVVLPPALAALLELFGSALASVAAALLLVVVVVAVASYGRRSTGLVAAVTAAASFDFFLTEPVHRFAVAERSEVETTVLLLVVGVAVTEIATRARRHRVVATVDEAHLAAIARTTSLVASGVDPRRVVAAVTEQLTALFDGATCRFESTVFGGLPRLQADGSVVFDGDRWDVPRLGLPTVGLEVLAVCHGRPLGRFVVTPRRHALMPAQAAQVVLILAGQAGAALERDARNVVWGGARRPQQPCINMLGQR